MLSSIDISVVYTLKTQSTGAVLEMIPWVL